MIDLINKNVDEIIKKDVNALQAIINKYRPVLELVDKKSIPYLAFIFNISIIYLKKNHSEINKDWRSWSVIVVKRLYEQNRIKKESEITAIIDDFIEYKIAEHDNYCENIISATEYDRDNGFVNSYINKKNR